MDDTKGGVYDGGKGIKIKVNFQTGERAGGIDPRDRGLLCDPTWQNIDEGVEIRLITDDRDVERYQNIPGVEVIEGKEAINAEIDKISPVRYSVTHPELFNESIKQKGIDLKDIDHTYPLRNSWKSCTKRGYWV